MGVRQNKMSYVLGVTTKFAQGCDKPATTGSQTRVNNGNGPVVITQDERIDQIGRRGRNSVYPCCQFYCCHG